MNAFTMPSPFASSFLTPENLIAILIVLFSLLGLTILLSFLQRLTNNRTDREMRRLIPEFEKVCAEAGQDAADPDHIRRTLPPARFRYFERFLRITASAITHDLDVGSRRTVARMSGFSAALRQRALKSRGWKRALALRTLSTLRDRENIPLFRDALARSHFYQIQYAASLGLALCRDADSIGLILTRLFRADHPNRDAILTVFEAYGAGACPRLTRILLEDTAPPMVQTALIDFLRIHDYHPARTAIEQIVRNTEKREILIHAVEALGLLGNPDSVPLIEPHLSSEQVPLRLKAVVAMAQLTGPAALPLLEKSMEDPDWWVRRNAAEALCSIGVAGVALLEKHAAHPDSPAGRTARMVLAEDRHDRLRWRYRFDAAHH